MTVTEVPFDLAEIKLDAPLTRPGNVVKADLIGRLCTENVDRKSTRLNSSHVKISYAVFCLKKKTFLQLGSPDANAEDILARRERFGISYVVVFGCAMEAFAPVVYFFLNDTATTEIYTLSLHDALPISPPPPERRPPQVTPSATPIASTTHSTS